MRRDSRVISVLLNRSVVCFLFVFVVILGAAEESFAKRQGLGGWSLFQTDTHKVQSLPTHVRFSFDGSLKLALLQEKNNVSRKARLLSAEKDANKKSRLVSSKRLLEPVREGAGSDIAWSLIALQTFSAGMSVAFYDFIIRTLSDVLFLSPTSTVGENSFVRLMTSLFVLTSAPWIIAIVVSSIGKLGNTYEGSFWWTLLGAYGGQAVAFGLNLLLSYSVQGSKLSKSGTISLMILSVALNSFISAMGGVLFYTLFRRPFADVERIGALIQYDQGLIRLGQPIPMIAVDPNRSSVSVTFPLFAGRF